jgi:hypothetical protein
METLGGVGIHLIVGEDPRSQEMSDLWSQQIPNF